MFVSRGIKCRISRHRAQRWDLSTISMLLSRVPVPEEAFGENNFTEFFYVLSRVHRSCLTRSPWHPVNIYQ